MEGDIWKKNMEENNVFEPVFYDVSYGTWEPNNRQVGHKLPKNTRSFQRKQRATRETERVEQRHGNSSLIAIEVYPL